ncbi:MAG: SDR family oxidoreductase [Burkholderiales bacterium]|nr:SDR family oxidoreductase [Burkholderiales bacterium]
MSGTRVLITGASSGIGAALAREYVRRDARVGLVARRAGTLARLADELRGRCTFYPADVRDAAGMRQVAARFIAEHGGADVVIANAGVSAGTLTEHFEDHAVFREIMDINVLGMVHTFSPFLPAMRAAGAGTLVGIASVAGIRGLPGAGAYSASKSAAITYLESLRVECHGSGVRVLTIAPGYIATPMTAANPYRMPFIVPADTAALRMADVIEQGRAYTVIPWQMGVVALGLRALPRWLHDRLFARAKRKPRRVPG